MNGADLLVGLVILGILAVAAFMTYRTLTGKERCCECRGGCQRKNAIIQIDDADCNKDAE